MEAELFKLRMRELSNFVSDAKEAFEDGAEELALEKIESVLDCAADLVRLFQNE